MISTCAFVCLLNTITDDQQKKQKTDVLISSVFTHKLLLQLTLISNKDQVTIINHQLPPADDEPVSTSTQLSDEIQQLSMSGFCVLGDFVRNWMT